MLSEVRERRESEEASSSAHSMSHRVRTEARKGNERQEDNSPDNLATNYSTAKKIPVPVMPQQSKLVKAVIKEPS